jgi:hypothetical protein
VRLHVSRDYTDAVAQLFLSLAQHRVGLPHARRACAPTSSA